MNKEENLNRFRNKYEAMCKEINKRGIYTKLSSINGALSALIENKDYLEEIDKYMIYNLLLVAKSYDKKIKVSEIPSKYKLQAICLSANLKEIENLQIKQDDYRKR